MLLVERESVVLLILGDEMVRPYMLRVREVAIMIMMRNERMTTSKAGGRLGCRRMVERVTRGENADSKGSNLLFNQIIQPINNQ